MRARFAWFALILGLAPVTMLRASSDEKPVKRTYITAPPAPMSQTPEMVAGKSSGCLSCHVQTDQPTMHA